MSSPHWTPAPKRGIIPLRPLDFGTILGKSFAMLRHNPSVLLGFGVCTQLVVGLLGLGLFALIFAGNISRLETLTPSDPPLILGAGGRDGESIALRDALAREKHFRRAAEACHVSQPTLSAAIVQLEEELGVMIVERGRRFQGFTKEGEVVLAHARRILAEAEVMKDSIAELRYYRQFMGRLGGNPVG